MVNFLEREVERLIYFEKRPEVQGSERRATGAEEKDNKLMRSVDVIFISRNPFS